jgi:hypothetical protein
MWIMSCPNAGDAGTKHSAARRGSDQYPLPENAECVPSGDLILSDTEVASRMRLLGQLRTALETAGVRCVLARRHRLVLRYNRGPHQPSGLTDPQLRLYSAPQMDIVTTDGAVYRLASGGEFAVDDPSAVVEAITGRYLLTTPS